MQPAEVEAVGRRQQQRVPAQAQEAREHPQKTWPQCLQWCLRTTTEKSVLHSLHQNTALSLTQRGPFSLCFGCWNFLRGLPWKWQHASQGRGRREGRHTGEVKGSKSRRHWQRACRACVRWRRFRTSRTPARPTLSRPCVA